MSKNMFITEMKNELNTAQRVCLRNLYTPILGTGAIMLYQILIDYHKFNMGNPSYYLFKDISKTLRMEETELITELIKLESLGLIRRFEKTDGIHFIITINPPLTPKELIKNKIITNHAKKQIGELIFERIIFSLKESVLDKASFREVTKKYQDIFDLEIEIKQNNTLEIQVPKFSNIDEAIKSLAPSQFIKYISGNKVTPIQLSLVQKLQNSGFASDSINQIIKYSYLKNNKIVSRHIEVIAEDFVKKNILKNNKVEEELNAAFSNAYSTIGEKKYTEQKSKKTENNDLSWNDIFDSLGGEF
ncbi:MAG: DnaD domain protein [Mycoplasmataceae bacterium]|nr:DnaD domain protein [Mycoplasmataceae bacterium]